VALADWFDGFFARRGIPANKNSDFAGKADVFFSILKLVWT
jgi:hypothetical protein